MRKILIALFCFAAVAVTAQKNYNNPLVLDIQKLDSIKKVYESGGLLKSKSFRKFLRNTDELLEMKPLSVTMKKQSPPSGNKHDYLSMSPYWWPDPLKKDGLPYIRRDGERNPEIYEITDNVYHGKIVEAANNLSISFYITGKELYAEKAAELLRVWYLNDDTKMNPNLNYAQFVPGASTGRSFGIIETSDLYKTIDAVCLLGRSKAWLKSDDDKISKWFSDYLNWLMTSENGIEEGKAKNNHGTWYNVQIAALSIFLGKNEFAKNILEESKTTKLEEHILDDGRQPLELARTKSWSYSVFNLYASILLAKLGERVDVNLWHYPDMQNSLIIKAFNYLVSYADKMDEWPYKQIEKSNIERLFPIAFILKNKVDENTFENWSIKLNLNERKIPFENTLIYR